MAETSETPIRRQILFHGRVQGVGFRYTTASIARRYPVTGYVRNLSDGSVELIADAVPVVLDRFVAEIGSEFAGKIRQQVVCDIERAEQFTVFEIRR